MDYQEFLSEKSQLNDGDGFTPEWMPSFLFDFQSGLVDWALRRGRAAIFADCGMGKTPMQLVWAENVLTPFMGVGSEVYSSVLNGRRAIGIELKESYFHQALQNIQDAEKHCAKQSELAF